MLKETAAALGIAAGISVPSSLEALMLVPCIIEVHESVQYPEVRRVTIQPGENLWEIARREYGTPWAYGALAITNGIPDPERIRAGGELVIYTGRTATLEKERFFEESVCPAVKGHRSMAYPDEEKLLLVRRTTWD